MMTMNYDFLKGRHNPDPPALIIANSKSFIIEELAAANYRVREAENALDAAEAANDEETFAGGSVIAKAHRNVQEKEAIRDHAQRKLTWETQKGYERHIRTDVKYTKRLLAGIDWKRIRKP